MVHAQRRASSPSYERSKGSAKNSTSIVGSVGNRGVGRHGVWRQRGSLPQGRQGRAAFGRRPRVRAGRRSVRRRWHRRRRIRSRHRRHEGGQEAAHREIEGIGAKIAALLGTADGSDPHQRHGREPGCRSASICRYRAAADRMRSPVIVRVEAQGKLEVLSLDNVSHSRPSLPNAPDGRRRRAGGGATARLESITDLAFVDGSVIIAGLSNEEFASNAARGCRSRSRTPTADTSVEIFHGAHGQFETRSPVRTFAALQDRRRAAHPGRLHLHAAGAVPGRAS